LAYGQAVSQGSGDLSVMTYNANEGKDYLEVERATTSSQFLIAVGQTITQVSATDPPARMRALATQILAAQPTLVSLQELDHWYSGFQRTDRFVWACVP
jgi:protease II